MPQTTAKPWARVVILLVALAAALFLSRYFSQTWIPTDPRDALIFQNALLLVVLGSALIEHKYTKPADSVLNGLFGMITLVTVYQVAPATSWWVVFGYCTVVFLLSVACSLASSGPQISGWQKKVAELTFRPSVLFGQARVLYSIVFLYGLLSFYGLQDHRTIAFVLFWGLFIALWPMGVPEILSSLTEAGKAPTSIGRVVRNDWPDLLRVQLSDASQWDSDSQFVYAQADGQRRLVFPLYSRVQQDGVLATALCGPSIPQEPDGREAGHVYPLQADERPALEATILDLDPKELLGFIVEESSIGSIRFETWRVDKCAEGALVYCQIGKRTVYYQIAEGVTREESLESDRHGFQVAVATQLGVLDDDRGFRKYPWLPPMNTPVMGVPEDFGDGLLEEHDRDFSYGRIPGSNLPVRGGFSAAMEHHTAILGVTGSGKTELAYDLIAHAVEAGIKVVCIDITAKYAGRLDHLAARDLSITHATSAKLSDRLFAVETGTYGAPKEKEALKEFADELRQEVRDSVEGFLTSTDDDARVGIVTLEEISNTKASIFITELFLTGILEFARDESDECPRVLIVIEEAHTVVPEATTMGLGDYDSRGLVGKIAQIALQGRKFGVGLLVIGQRTATVSKTVLTQCNTMITLNCFDETSLKFLANVYGRAHTDMISNLPFLHALVYGKGVRSDRPVMVQIPFSEDKAKEGG